MALRRIRARVKSWVARLMHPGLVQIEAHLHSMGGRLEKIEERLGRIEGRLGVTRANKDQEELAWWRWLIRTEEGRRSLPGGEPFERVFGGWQRDRLRELGRNLGLETDDDLDAWCARQSAVEIGAGPYPALAAAPGWRRAVAVDPLAAGYAAEGLLAGAARHVVYMEAPGERVPLPTASADLVIIENALDHVSDPAAVLREISRLLRPGGLLWLLVDLSNHRDHMHPHCFDAAAVRALLGATGFVVVQDRVSDHKCHPKAYGEYRGLLRKPGGEEPPMIEVRTTAEARMVPR